MSAHAIMLQRKSACGQHTAGGQCEECKKKDQKVQRRSISPSGPAVAPPIVHEVLRSPGQPLDQATRTFMEPRFGHDFSGVHVHTGERADESARAVNALAYTVGRELVFAKGQFAPATDAGRQLLVHELAHVVQQGGGASQFSEAGLVEAHDSLSEREADAAENVIARGADFQAAVTAPPAVRRKIDPVTGKVLYGELSFKMEPQMTETGLKESTRISFSPDASGPQTKQISFIQIAKTAFDDRHTWGQGKPKEVDIDRFTTVEGSRTHITAKGDTLASISQQHFHTSARASAIADANAETLAPLDTGLPLPEGLHLTIPAAVEAGFHVDIDPTDKKTRGDRSAPNVPPEYPHMAKRQEVPKDKRPAESSGIQLAPQSNLVPAFGKNLPGEKQDAVMMDTPGGGLPGEFKFETAAHSEDLGLYYGAVRWGFRHDPFSKGDQYTQEWSAFSANVSDTLGDSIAAFNKFYMNKHIVQQGETLSVLAMTYYGDASRATAIFERNKGVLPTGDPDAPLKAGTELDMPGKQWERAKLFPGQNVWEKAKQDSQGGAN